MPVKSHSNTKKKKYGSTKLSKSSTAKRSKNTSRKAGKKRGGGPKTIRKTTNKDKMPDDLPLPNEYTAEQRNEDTKYFEKTVAEFYNSDEDVKNAKAMPTDTRQQREYKKKTFADFPSSIEDYIFEQINEEMKPELENYDKKKIKRDNAFAKIIAKLGDDQDNDPEYYMQTHDKIVEAHNLWKPEKDSSVTDDDGYPVWAPEHNPRSYIEEAHYTRMGALNDYIISKWNEGWRKAVDEHTTESGRKLTDVLIEDFSIPHVVAVLNHKTDTWDMLTSETYYIEEWDNAWNNANIAEYRGSAEFEKNINDKMNQTKKNRTTVVAELNKNIKTEEKIRADAEKEENRKAKATEATANEKYTDDNAKSKRMRIFRARISQKRAAELNLKPAPTSASAHAPAPTPTPAPTPAPAPTPTPTPAPAAETISRAAADDLAIKHSNITIYKSRTHPNYYIYDSITGVSTWIKDTISRDDANNFVRDEPENFLIYKVGDTSYFLNKRINARATILD